MSTRITDLPQAEALNGSEIMPLVQNGVTKKATLNFINLAAPAALILQQTQQVYQDTVDVKTATDAVLIETQSVLGDTQVVLGQTIAVRNETEALKLDFETQYLGPHASPPTLDNEGNPLENGALYWDTSLMAMFVWDGANWTAFSSAVASVNGFIGEVVLGFADVGAAGPGANTNITSLSGLTGDIETATGLQFDTLAPSAGAVGKLTWNTTDQTLDLGVSAGGVVMQIGQEVYYRVKNGTAGVIPNGSMVRYTGTEGLAGNILVAPALADGTFASQTFLGLTTEALNPGDSGFATYFGRVRGIDTTGNPYGEVWADGDVIFASALVAGWLTKNPPEAPNNRVRVGIVVHAHPNGTMFVRPTYGGKLSENEQVELTSLADGDVLKYVAANGRFENMDFTTAQIEPLGAAAASMAAHLLDADPHPQYTTTAEASAAAPVQSVAGKTGAVSLTNADVGLGNVANVLQAAAARILTAGDGLTGGGDLSADRSFVLGTPSTLTTSTTNAVTATSHTHAVTFPVTSVAGKTGAVALVKADVGLDQVDNTSDANKPVSTATATALNLKFDKTGGSITGNTNLVVNSASEALRITQTGTGLALRVEDSANVDATPFVVDANGNVGVKTAAPAVSFAVNATDAILVPAGSIANRPTGATGYFRFNTELAQFEGYNGTAWGAIGADDASTIDFQQAGAGSVVRTAQDKMRELVSVKDFGAVGDGVADDRAAIQLAINAAYGKTLYIPAGQYLLSSVGAADAILQIANRIRIVADFGAAFIYGSAIAATVDVIRVDPLTIADEGVEIDGLWIHEQSGSPARDVIRIRLDATHGLKKLRINRCLFRSKTGRAIHCTNAGELNANGLFFAQLTQSEFSGGVTLEGLGDSNEIADCAITGPGVGINVTMLSPSAPGATSAKLGIRRNNITALGGAIIINRGRNVTIEDNNIEQIAPLSGGYCIQLALTDYDIPGVSTIRNNKIEPNDPISECGGISLYRCKGTQIYGNQIGASAKSGSYTIAVALGECSALRVFANDLQLSADCVGVFVDSLSKNVSYQRGKITPFSTYTEISDSGIGTKGVAKTPTFENGWANNAEAIAAVKFEKDDIGNVALSGAAASGTLTADTVIFTLPQGFRPMAREVFSTYCYTAGGVTGRALVRVDPDGSVRLRYTSEGAAQLLEVGLAGIRFDGLDA